MTWRDTNGQDDHVVTEAETTVTRQQRGPWGHREGLEQALLAASVGTSPAHTWGPDLWLPGLGGCVSLVKPPGVWRLL